MTFKRASGALCFELDAPKIHVDGPCGRITSDTSLHCARSFGEKFPIQNVSQGFLELRC